MAPLALARRAAAVAPAKRLKTNDVVVSKQQQQHLRGICVPEIQTVLLRYVCYQNIGTYEWIE